MTNLCSLISVPFARNGLDSVAALYSDVSFEQFTDNRFFVSEEIQSLRINCKDNLVLL